MCITFRRMALYHRNPETNRSFRGWHKNVYDTIKAFACGGHTPLGQIVLHTSWQSVTVPRIFSGTGTSFENNFFIFPVPVLVLFSETNFFPYRYRYHPKSRKFLGILRYQYQIPGKFPVPNFSHTDTSTFSGPNFSGTGTLCCLPLNLRSAVPRCATWAWIN